MQYEIVQMPDPVGLQREVQHLLRLGWRPQGGVAVVTDGQGAWRYAQAVVLRPRKKAAKR